MASVNKVIIIGNLGRDPEMRYTTGGDAVCNMSLACTETWKDKSGTKQERTEWVRIVLFGRTAEVAGEYLKKGSSCYIEGRLQTKKYTDKDGVEKYATEVVGDRLQLLGSPRSEGERTQAPARERSPAGPSTMKNTGDFDDEIPFVLNECACEVWSRFDRRIARRGRATLRQSFGD